jgi:hypothetical protein
MCALRGSRPVGPRPRRRTCICGPYSSFDLGFRDAVLWVLAGNVRGERFYRNDRWAPDGVCRTDVVWGTKVDEVRYKRALSSS